MALINDPDNLSQGAVDSTITDARWSASAGVTTTITSALAALPAVAAGDFFVIRNATFTENNGLYLESGGTPTTSSITADKITGANPTNHAVDNAITFLGDTTTKLNIAWIVETKECVLLEQNGLSADGVEWQTVYSKALIDWKDDAFLIANAPFPFTAIDADAGKYLIGQDSNGNNNGWTFLDDAGNSIRTRKLLRSGGVNEVDANGNLTATYVGIGTLGGFEDEANDTAYYQFGNDTTVDDSSDFTFAGPVNEMLLCYERLADATFNGGTGVAIDTAGRTLTRADGGNWSTDGGDGFKVGGRIVIRDAENATSDTVLDGNVPRRGFLLSAVGQGVDGALTLGTAAVATPNGFDLTDNGASPDLIDRNDGGSWIDEGYFVGGSVTVNGADTVGNDGTYTITALTASQIQIATGSFSASDTDSNAVTFGPINPAGTPDTTMNGGIDNRSLVTLRHRVRDGDTNGKTFDQAGLSDAGAASLVNRFIQFPLANATDLKITETDANIDANTPYTGMTLTVHSAAQSLGGSGADELVGGPYNFGFVINCNGGTDVQVYEWVQRQLRKLTDIDADADTAIGRTLDGLMRFLGDSLEAGSTDGGLTFPTNPQGGGSGVFLQDLAAASRNTTTMFDNTGTQRNYPIGTPVTLDFNQTALDDTAFAYTLFFDYTIRNAVSDLIITLVSGPTGTFDSAGANLPAAMDVDPDGYVRVTGMTGADAPMNGIYQVTATTSTSQWNVTRYDGDTIVTTASTSCNVDEHPVDSPDAVIVQDDTPTNVTGTNPSADVTFTFAYSTNVQGGRTASTDADVVLRGVGQTGAQYAVSSVATIPSATATTIPLATQIERNFNNP